MDTFLVFGHVMDTLWTRCLFFWTRFGHASFGHVMDTLWTRFGHGTHSAAEARQGVQNH